MDVPLDVRRDPLSTDDLAGLEVYTIGHLCDHVRTKTDASYLCRMNTCLVDSVVSLNPLGLL